MAVMVVLPAASLLEGYRMIHNTYVNTSVCMVKLRQLPGCMQCNCESRVYSWAQCCMYGPAQGVKVYPATVCSKPCQEPLDAEKHDSCQCYSVNMGQTHALTYDCHVASHSTATWTNLVLSLSSITTAQSCAPCPHTAHTIRQRVVEHVDMSLDMRVVWNPHFEVKHSVTP